MRNILPSNLHIIHIEYKDCPLVRSAHHQSLTLDQVLNAPKTDYLFFVAKKDFTEGHVFHFKIPGTFKICT
jgi:hypothetical protein